MLVLEDLVQNSFVPIALITIEVHSSAMDCIELVLDVSRCPWRSLSASRCRIAVPLGY